MRNSNKMTTGPGVTPKALTLKSPGGLKASFYLRALSCHPWGAPRIQFAQFAFPWSAGMFPQTFLPIP